MIDTVKAEAKGRLMTARELLLLGSHGPYRELWDGHSVVRSPSGGGAEDVAARVMGPLAVHVHRRRLGWVALSEQGFFVKRNPDRVLTPDGAFTSRDRLPQRPTRGFFPCAPDFCIEVRSPTDSWTETAKKCGIWISHGVRVVWGIDPDTKLAAVFREHEPVREYGPGDTVSAAPALPRFRLAVDKIFEV